MKKVVQRYLIIVLVFLFCDCSPSISNKIVNKDYQPLDKETKKF